MPPTKSKRLIDVIGEQEKSQDLIVKRLKKLEISIKLRNPPMDDPDLRWIENKIEESDGGVVPNRQELEYANTLWKIYK